MVLRSADAALHDTPGRYGARFTPPNFGRVSLLSPSIPGFSGDRQRWSVTPVIDATGAPRLFWLVALDVPGWRSWWRRPCATLLCQVRATIGDESVTAPEKLDRERPVHLIPLPRSDGDFLTSPLTGGIGRGMYRVQ